jgi:hypothetical protein
MSASAVTPIPVDRSASLFRWNAALSALHLAQAIAILAISFAKNPIATSPIVGTYLRFDEATKHLVTAQRPLWDLPLGPMVALFFFMSALAHFSMAFPIRKRYEDWLARGQNPMAMIMFGWSMEVANEGRDRPQWIHYVFGCIVGAVPWLVIFVTLLVSATEPNSAPIPGFVIAIFVTLFIFFNVFAANMVLQYRKIGRWRDYLYGERAYMLFSLLAKSALAWQVFFGTLRP